MVPRSKPTEAVSAGGTERRFFLLNHSGSGSWMPAHGKPEHWKPELRPEDAEHARVVLRMEAGDRCVGLDGVGSAWPLVVTVADRKRFEVEVAGVQRTEPAPGEPGAALPWIEVAVAMPKGSRAEEMLDALVQLGVASVTPLVARRSPPQGRSEGESRRKRLERIAREACKQSGRLWNVELGQQVDVAGLAAREGADILRLDPRAERGLGKVLERSFDWAEKSSAAKRPNWTREHPLVIAVGPEGGFEADEERALDAAGAKSASIAPHILRIETAAIAALAVIVDRLGKPPIDT